MNLLREPLLTFEMAAEDFSCPPDSLYLYGTGPEERSALDAQWVAAQDAVDFVEIAERPGEIVVAHGNLVRLRDRASLQELVSSAGWTYLDITGMTYATWAPLLSAALSSGQPCRVIYREPGDYQRSPTPTRGMIYDLSERVGGIAPIPGMASIRRRPKLNSVLVPLLGFEGPRFAHILESTEPDPDRVVPIIGAPGYRPEYTSQAMLANRLSLETEHHYSRIQFAKANCPFDLFHRLHEVQHSFGGDFLRIAPVGTKPHGLGAVLFALGRPQGSEIVYDHPVRKKARTSGLSRVCLYEVSRFAESDLFRGTGIYG